MAGFRRSVSIRRPVDEVFDFATDLANARVFLPSVTRAELITEGGLRPGARFRETRTMNGKERSAVIEVTEHERPRVHAAASAMMGMRAAYRFTFEPDDSGGTLVVMDAGAEGNWLWRPFLGLLMKVMEKEDGAYLERLRDALERPAPA